MFITFILFFTFIVPFTFSQPYKKDNKFWVERFGTGLRYDENGNPVFGEAIGQIKLENFTLDVRLSSSMVHSKENKVTEVENRIYLEPNETIFIDPSIEDLIYTFNLTRLKFSINNNEIPIRILYQIDYFNSGDFLANRGEIFLYGEQTQSYIVGQELNYELSFAFEIYSNNSRFVSNNETVLLGESELFTITMDLYVSDPSILIAIIIFSFIILVLLTYIKLQRPFNPGDKSAKSELTFRTILLPNGFLFLLILLMSSRDYYELVTLNNVKFPVFTNKIIIFGYFDLIFGLTINNLIFYFILPTLFDFTRRNYFYKGVSTLIGLSNDIEPSKPKYVTEMKEGMTKASEIRFPNTMKLEKRLVAKAKLGNLSGKNVEIINQKIMDYEFFLFAALIFRIIAAGLIIAFSLWLSPFNVFSLVFITSYLVWVYLRKINPNNKIPLPIISKLENP